ncbi:hypothetical protein RSAG8_11052, partial [Rhizoctonia solani AG-8 WAC10335]
MHSIVHVCLNITQLPVDNINTGFPQIRVVRETGAHIEIRIFEKSRRTGISTRVGKQGRGAPGWREVFVYCLCAPRACLQEGTTHEPPHRCFSENSIRIRLSVVFSPWQPAVQCRRGPGLLERIGRVQIVSA